MVRRFFLQPANHSVATQGPSKHEFSLDIQSNYCLQILYESVDQAG